METYNEKQKQAIESLDNNIVIKAPPGSGKTFTMVESINHYIKKNPSAQVTAITFTVKAAEEIKNQLAFTGANLHISTVHSWSYTQLEKLADKHEFKLRLLQEEAIKEFIGPMLKARNVQKSALNKAYNFLMTNQTIHLSDVLKKKLQFIRDDYIDFKRARFMYDFTDLPLYLYTKLKDYNETITGIDALFVDEFQDIDPIQLQVFDLIKANKRFYIGDPDQSIYLFRGASSRVFDSLEGFTTYELEVNYRSYQEILNFASTMKTMADQGLIKYISKIDFTDQSPIKAQRGFGGSVICINPPAMINYISHADYYDPVVAVSQELQLPYHILCRTNKEVKKLQELGCSFVSTIHQAKGLEYDNVAVIDFELSSEEEINIAYVALTRAKNRLLITDIATIEQAKKSILL